ncbi:MAG: tetratricopeptide repeat protein [Bacteroidia bacterium]|nr:tetratricopeptide repeat protein [Bacteroidia bacterium]
MNFRFHIFIYVLLSVPALLNAQKRTVDSLLQVLETAPDREKIRIYLKLSNTVMQGKPTRGVYYAKEALYLARQFKDDSARANAWHSTGTAYIYFPDYYEASIYLDSALQMRTSLNDTLGCAKTLNNLGLANFNEGEYRKAIDFYSRSIEKRKQSGDLKGIVNSLMGIGNSYRSIGEFEEAYKYFNEGLHYAEQLKDDDQIATAYINIAILYSDQKRYSEALVYQLDALEIKQKSGSKKSIASALSNVGTTYMNLKNYGEALHFLLQSLKIREEINDQKGMGTTCNNIAELFLAMGEYKKAQEYCERSLQIREDMGDRPGIASTLSNLATIYEKLGRIQDAINTLEHSREIFEELESKTLLVSAYKALSALYAKQNNYKLAWEYQVKYADLNDTLFQEDTFRQMAELQTKYDSEKQKKQLELLEKDNQLKEQKARNTWYLLMAFGIAALIIGYILYTRYKLKQKANEKLSQAYREIEEKNKDITDSIIYAKRIQEAVLPSDEQVKTAMPDSFVLYKPKDIVSGDFYWIEKVKALSIFAAVDCTGHGVPGAFLSMVGNSLLNQMVFERGLTQPAEILNNLNAALQETLLKGVEGQEVKDGMDVALCAYDPASRTLQFAAAFNPMFIARCKNGKYEMEEVKADKISIGISDSAEKQHFRDYATVLHPGDCVYIFTDGFADQFGGQEGKKFKYGRFKEILRQIAEFPAPQQKAKLHKEFEEWKMGYDQVDDVLIIGFKV